MSSLYFHFRRVAGLLGLTIWLLCTQRKLAALSHVHSNIPPPPPSEQLMHTQNHKKYAVFFVFISDN
jgi:hypothetical protein